MPITNEFNLAWIFYHSFKPNDSILGNAESDKFRVDLTKKLQEVGLHKKRPGIIGFILDFTDVTHLSNDSLAVVLGVKRQLKMHNVPFVIAGLRDQPLAKVEQVGLTEGVTIYQAPRK